MDNIKRILVVGACGQIGTELCTALRRRHGGEAVIAADLRNESNVLKGTGPYIRLDILDKDSLKLVVQKHHINTIYLLAAMLSASGEKDPQIAWHLNMQGLLNTLDISVSEKIDSVFWPSSIAAFGPDAPRQNCPQQTILSPATAYGISKVAGEQWCQYYYKRYGLNIRSIRFPGLISHKTIPGGGTTDYAIEIFAAAVKNEKYECFLRQDTRLPMMYMDDAVRAIVELMDAPSERLSVRTSYNISSMSFTPAELTGEIAKYIQGFQSTYQPDFRQSIADSWPDSIDDYVARLDWGWKAKYCLSEMTSQMLANSFTENPIGLKN